MPRWLSQPYIPDWGFLPGSIHKGPDSKPKVGVRQLGVGAGGCSGDAGL